MLRKLEYRPCIPTRGTKVPSGPDWFHEIKHNGYRLIVQREGKRVRLLTRRGYDWSGRYPPHHPSRSQAPQKLFRYWRRGGGLRSGRDLGFRRLHAGKRNVEARLYAFDLLMDEGVDMRDEALQVRKFGSASS